MDNIISYIPVGFNGLRNRSNTLAKTIESRFNKRVKMLQFKLVDGLPRIIWFVTTSL